MDSSCQALARSEEGIPFLHRSFTCEQSQKSRLSRGGEEPRGSTRRRRRLAFYFLEAMFDPFVPVAEHVEPFHFPLSGNFNSAFFLTVTRTHSNIPAGGGVNNPGRSPQEINKVLIIQQAARKQLVEEEDRRHSVSRTKGK